MQILKFLNTNIITSNANDNVVYLKNIKNSLISKNKLTYAAYGRAGHSHAFVFAGANKITVDGNTVSVQTDGNDCFRFMNTVNSSLTNNKCTSDKAGFGVLFGNIDGAHFKTVNFIMSRNSFSGAHIGEVIHVTDNSEVSFNVKSTGNIIDASHYTLGEQNGTVEGHVSFNDGKVVFPAR